MHFRTHAAPTAVWRLCALALTGAVATLGLQSCGGGGGAAAPAVPAPTLIQGTVAVGAAVSGATVTVRDADAATADVAGIADAGGTYSLDVSSLKPPLVVNAAGMLNGEVINVVAVVPEVTASTANTANVTPLTNAVAALVAPAGDLNALTSATAIAALSPAAVAGASALVVNTLKSDPQFASLLGTAFDPLKTPFSANGTGIDEVLDKVAVAVGSSGVAITNLAAPASESTGQSAAVVLTAAQVGNPASAPSLPLSADAGSLPTTAELTALAQKIKDCLALPLAQRVTLDANHAVTAVSAECSFAPAQWKSDGGGWAERVGTNLLRYEANTGMKVGTPTMAVVLAPPNHSGTVFQHPYCNTQTCVIMNVPMTSASGRPTSSIWVVGKIDDQWNIVGNQLPYAIGVEHRLNRKVAVNTALALAKPGNYYLKDRQESAIRLTFNPGLSGAANTAKIRAVVWKGPGLPDAGVVTHRSQRCGTADRFAISNQEGLLTDNNSVSVQSWNNDGSVDFIVDSAMLDGSALAMPVPTTGWATTATPLNQDIRSGAFTGTVAAWSGYKAEIYYYANIIGLTPDEVVYVRNGTPFEPAARGTARNWPQLSAAFIDSHLTPTGSAAGSLSSLSQTLEWTNPSDGYVTFGYLFSQNRELAINVEGETTSYWKRSSLWFRLNALGDSSATSSEWAAKEAGTALATRTENSGNNPNPRCTGDEVLPLDADSARSSYREAGLQSRGADRKLYQLIHFWSN